MDRWIRWRVKDTWSLWHRAPAAKAYVRVRRVGQEIEFRDFQPSGPVESPRVLHLRTIYRYTACGFVVPPHEMVEEWSSRAMPPDAMPPLPRCVWCVHGWVVDTAPPSGAPPAQGGEPGRTVIRARGKKPPTQHA